MRECPVCGNKYASFYVPMAELPSYTEWELFISAFRKYKAECESSMVKDKIDKMIDEIDNLISGVLKINDASILQNIKDFEEMKKNEKGNW